VWYSLQECKPDWVIDRIMHICRKKLSHMWTFLATNVHIES